MAPSPRSDRLHADDARYPPDHRPGASVRSAPVVFVAASRPDGHRHPARLQQHLTQLFLRSRRHDLSVVQDKETVAGLTDLRKDVAGDQDGVGVLERPDHPAHLHDLHGVEVVGGLVQNEKLGFVDDRLCHANPLAVTLRKMPGGHIGHLGNSGALFDFGNAPGHGLRGHSLDASGEGQIVAHRHVPVDGWNLGQVSHPLPHLVRVVQHIQAVDSDTAGRRPQTAGQNSQQRGLPHTVQSQEPNRIALFDFARHRAQGPFGAVVFGDFGQLDHCVSRANGSERGKKTRRGRGQVKSASAVDGPVQAWRAAAWDPGAGLRALTVSSLPHLPSPPTFPERSRSPRGPPVARTLWSVRASSHALRSGGSDRPSVCLETSDSM